jgi:hypothetical protein
MEAGTKQVTHETIRKPCKIFKILDYEYVRLERLIKSNKASKQNFVSACARHGKKELYVTLAKYIEWDLNKL